jgi:hypothetical protein
MQQLRITAERYLARNGPKKLATCTRDLFGKQAPWGLAVPALDFALLKGAEHQEQRLFEGVFVPSARERGWVVVPAAERGVSDYRHLFSYWCWRRDRQDGVKVVAVSTTRGRLVSAVVEADPSYSERFPSTAGWTTTVHADSVAWYQVLRLGRGEGDPDSAMWLSPTSR